MSNQKHTAISMACPYCGVVDGHQVARTESEHHIIPLELRLVTGGEGYVERYRERTRACTSCHREFSTAEIWQRVLDRVDHQIRQWREENQDLERECKWLRRKLEQIEGIIAAEDDFKDDSQD